MGKLLLRSLLVVGLLSLPAFSASAASIDLGVGPGGELIVDNQTSLDVGGVSILTTGATGFTFNSALPTLSVLDSVFVLDIGVPPYSMLVANSAAVGVPLVAGGSQALLGTFQIPDPSAFGIFSGDELLGGTVSDPYGNLLVPDSVSSYRLGFCDPPGPCPYLPYHFVMTFVPEPFGPAGFALLAVTALAALVATQGGRLAVSEKSRSPASR